MLDAGRGGVGDEVVAKGDTVRIKTAFVSIPAVSPRHDEAAVNRRRDRSLVGCASWSLIDPDFRAEEVCHRIKDLGEHLRRTGIDNRVATAADGCNVRIEQGCGIIRNRYGRTHQVSRTVEYFGGDIT